MQFVFSNQKSFSSIYWEALKASLFLAQQSLLALAVALVGFDIPNSGFSNVTEN